MAQLVKNPPAMQETWVQSLGWDHPLETGKVILLEERTYKPMRYSWGGITDLSIERNKNICLELPFRREDLPRGLYISPNGFGHVCLYWI